MWIVAYIVEKTIDETRRDRAAAHGDRTGNRFAELVASQARNQVLAFVDGLRKIPELCAIAQKIRAHRHHDVNRDVALVRRFENKLYEGSGIVQVRFTLGNSSKPEYLLELIHND